MKGKTLNANKSRWLVALRWMNPPAPVLPRRAQGSRGWERMGGSRSLRGFRLVCSLRGTPLSWSLRFPIFQRAFGLDVLSDPSLLKPEPALLPPPPASCSLKPVSLDPGSTQPCSQLYVHGLDLREQARVPQLLYLDSASDERGKGEAVEDPKFCRNWDQPARVCLHGGVKRLGTRLLRRPGQKAGQNLGKLPGLRATSPPVRPLGGDNGHPYENMTLLSTAALLSVARRWTQPKCPLVDA